MNFGNIGFTEILLLFLVALLLFGAKRLPEIGKSLGSGIPSVSYNLRKGGHVLIDRSDGPTAVAAIRELRECEPLVRILGDPFISAYTIVKEAEYEVFLQVISSWEREHLLLNV